MQTILLLAILGMLGFICAFTYLLANIDRNLSIIRHDVEKYLHNIREKPIK